MEKKDIIKNIAKRSGGDIYLGVVGAVRTGKSTFIKRMVETLIVPNMEDEFEKKRTLDEIPQSASGKTIMTTEPKFIPNNPAKIKIDDFTCNIKLIDCVGYMIENAQGASDENGPRMVKTPWYNEEIPFTEAAEIGTEKVIKEHSTIGIVVTTDASIGEFERKDYLEAEKRVIEELKSLGKPFIVVLNSTHPTLPETEKIKEEIETNYEVPVLPISIESMTEKDMYDILREALYEFPDIINIHKQWFMDGFNAYLYAQELDKILNIGTQILNVESFLVWKNSNSTGLAEIDLGYIRNNHPTSKIVLPYEADRHLEHVKQLAKNGKLTLRGKNLYINKVMRCIEHTARLTNLNIVAQNGCFILYNPLEHDKGKPMIDTPLEDFWVNNPTFKILPTINCVNIHKSLAEYIIHNLIKNGVTRNTIYPDNRVMANNAYKQTKIN